MRRDTRWSISGLIRLNPGDDYPDFVIPLAEAVAAGKVDRGVAVCGSGVGASVCANKVPGVRAALIHDHFSAHQGVEDDHMNIICMGGRTVDRRSRGTWSRHFWQQNSARPSAICAAWAKWPRWKLTKVGQHETNRVKHETGR